MILCLICKEVVSIFKDYYLKRQYMQKHAAKFDSRQGVFYKDKIVELKNHLSSQQRVHLSCKKDSNIKATGYSKPDYKKIETIY